MLRFEDLINKKEETIEKIFRFLGLPVKESVKKFANKIVNYENLKPDWFFYKDLKVGRLEAIDAFGKPYFATSHGGIK